jgi:amino acid permease
MIIFGLLFGLGILAAIVYLALSKKSSFSVRFASIIALAFMIIAVIVCLFLIFGNPTVIVEKSILQMENPIPIQTEEDSGSVVLLLLVMLLLVLFAIIVISFIKERRKSTKI